MSTNGRTSGELTDELMKANMEAMGKKFAALMDEMLLNGLRKSGLLSDADDPRTRQMKPGDQVWLSADGLIRAPCDGRPGCKCDRVMAGCAVAKKGDEIVWVSAASGARGLMAFKLGAPHEWNLSALVDHSTDTDFHGNPKALAVPMGTFSNLLAPMKPLTADSILEAMKSMDAIKARDAETKKRYDDIVMSGLAGPAKRLRTFDEILAAPLPPMRATIPDYGASGYRYQPLLDDRPRIHAPTKPTPKTEKEIYQLQKLNDGDRKRVELFPVIREGAPRTQSQSIAAGLGVWGTRGDAKLPIDPKPYPYVSDEDLLPDA